ncbi:hypothetical protein ACH347_14785 [Saccharopolyspora sp. 5N102]|uniref:hypothetical protein n=1 Tax=Saccharopolyspora sp. 5N102 TaxID=3375155 RepID=UPI00378C190F
MSFFAASEAILASALAMSASTGTSTGGAVTASASIWARARLTSASAVTLVVCCLASIVCASARMFEVSA